MGDCPQRKEVFSIHTYRTARGIFLLALCLLLPSAACARILGPVSDYSALIAAAGEGTEGDILYVDGTVSAASEVPLSTPYTLTLTSLPGTRATVAGLHVSDALVVFSELNLSDSLTISGQSSIVLEDGTQVTGRGEAMSFSGSGDLMIAPGAAVIGLDGGSGLSISQSGGSVFGVIGGIVQGGDGITGGTGIVVSPLENEGLLFISGQVQGGEGSDVGGNAVNLYGLSGNAYVALTGTLSGGTGYIGGDGLQIISARGHSSVGVSAQIAGGNGQEYGGNALTLMNPEEQSSVSVSGALLGGDSLGAEGDPGQSLLIVGSRTLSHLSLQECDLRDGQAAYYQDSQTWANVMPPEPDEGEAIVPAEPVYDLPIPHQSDSQTAPDESSREEISVPEPEANGYSDSEGSEEAAEESPSPGSPDSEEPSETVPSTEAERDASPSEALRDL